MTPGDERALKDAKGCCGDDVWRGRLCEYHQGLADGYDTAAEEFEADRDKHAQAAELRDERWKIENARLQAEVEETKPDVAPRFRSGFEIQLTPEIMEDCRVMQEAFERDMEQIREHLNSSPPPKLFGGLQSRNNETGEAE